jgi:hypothetical protein
MNHTSERPSSGSVCVSVWVVLALAVLLPCTSQGQCPASPYNSETRIFKPIVPKAGNAVLANPLKNGSLNSDLEIVVLGDSVMWGNGLKDNGKFVRLAGRQIADKTQRCKSFPLRTPLPS